MKNFLLGLIAVAMVSSLMTTEAQAGFGKFNPDGLTISNGNDWEDEDVAIRVWILTEEQAQTPPATVGESKTVPSYITYPGVFFSTTRDAGNYVIVASNEAFYQSLGDDDAFTPGEVFAVGTATVTKGGGFVGVQVANSEDNPSLPVVTTD